MTIAIIGLGLIGGSLAKAIKKNTTCHVLGFDQSPDTVNKAFEEGAIDDICSGFNGVDLVFIALYPEATVGFLKEHADSFERGCIVIDLCGVKRFVCENVQGIFPQGVHFIGGHPMAGRETSGFESSSDLLFNGSSMILTPGRDIADNVLSSLTGFFKDLGFGHVEITTAEHHDEMIAYTSQLAHIVSSAYVKSPVARGYMGFSAGSFADMTRVAKLNEDMWTELFLHNGDFLCQQINTMIENLSDFSRAIAERDTDALRDMLREGREIKENLSREGGQYAKRSS